MSRSPHVCSCGARPLNLCCTRWTAWGTQTLEVKLRSPMHSVPCMGACRFLPSALLIHDPKPRPAMRLHCSIGTLDWAVPCWTVIHAGYTDLNQKESAHVQLRPLLAGGAQTWPKANADRQHKWACRAVHTGTCPHKQKTRIPYQVNLRKRQLGLQRVARAQQRCALSRHQLPTGPACGPRSARARARSGRPAAPRAPPQLPRTAAPLAPAE